MASIAQWILGFVVGYLVLMFGGAIVDMMVLAAPAAALFTIIMFIVAVMLGLRVVERGD